MNMCMVSDYNSEKEKGITFFQRAIVTLILHFSLFTFHSFAQVSSTNSTYSRFGLGLLHDQSQGFNKSMGGIGIGVRIGNRINTTNPASYSAIDSLSIILDAGMTGSFGQMQQSTQNITAKNASLDYVHAGMHIAKRLGLAVGFMPYTCIGYQFASPETVIADDANTTQKITCSNVYSGSGGINQAYIGLGWRAYRDLSVGVNVSFVWGQYNHILVPDYKEGGSSSSSYSSTIKGYYASLKTYKLDFGAQYPVRLSPQDWLNIGVTAGLGHKFAQDATLLIYSTKGDSTRYTATTPFDLPYSFGIGAAWQHKNMLVVGADVHHERWGIAVCPSRRQMTTSP